MVNNMITVNVEKLINDNDKFFLAAPLAILLIEVVFLIWAPLSAHFHLTIMFLYKLFWMYISCLIINYLFIPIHFQYWGIDQNATFKMFNYLSFYAYKQEKDQLLKFSTKL